MTLSFREHAAWLAIILAHGLEAIGTLALGLKRRQQRGYTEKTTEVLLPLAYLSCSLQSRCRAGLSNACRLNSFRPLHDQ